MADSPSTTNDQDTLLEQDLAALDRLEGRLYAHGYAQSALSCFGLTIDPPAASADRGEALAVLGMEDQELLCSPETGALLDRLQQRASELDDQRRAQVKILLRDRAELIDVPPEEQAAFTRLTVEAYDVWHAAKLSNDWASFEPYVDRLVDARKRFAGYIDPNRDPYDVCLDQNEHGLDHAFLDTFFAQVKDAVVPLIADIVAKGWQPSRACIEGRFDAAAQWDLANDLTKIEGLRQDALLILKTEHPFSDGITSDYAIVAGHVHEDDIISNVYSVLHEGGHALYEQGVDRPLSRTSLKGGTSMGIHESQSRFFENYIGRSEAFMPVLLEALSARFPGRFDSVTPHDLYLAVNRAEPSLIRTEADELTYPLHVIVRYEVERMLFSGEATARDIPGLWAQKYREYLGVEVPDDTHGALQDMHWSDGSFGYFPTYALGSAYGAQYLSAMRAGGMDFEAVCASGDLAPVREWLGQRIWRFGRAKDPAELIEGACGEPFDPTYYCDYLSRKFKGIYGL